MCSFLQQKAASDKNSEALVAWLAILRVRALLETVIGQRVPTLGIGRSPFVEWIRSYGSEGFHRCIASVEDALESLHPESPSQVEMDRLLDVFRTTVRLDMEVFSCMYSNVPKYSEYRMERDSPWNPCNLLFATDYDCTCTTKDTCELLIWVAEAVLHITDGRIMQAYHRIEAEHDVSVQDCLADLPDLTFDPSQKFTSEVEFELLPGMDSALGPISAAILDKDLYCEDRRDLKPVAGHPAIREALLELADLETETIEKVIAVGLLAGLRRKNIKSAGKKAVMQNHCLPVLRRLTKSGTCIHVISANWSRELILGGLSCLPEEMLYVHANELEFNESGISTGKFQAAVTNAFDKEHILEILRRIANQYVGPEKPACEFVPDDKGRMVVYIGDAQNDMLALLDADLGIIIGDNSVLRHLLLSYRIQVWPLVEASAHLSVSRLYGSHRSYRQSGILFEASGWEDVEACLFGQCTLRTTDQFWTYWRPPGQQDAKVQNKLSQRETPSTDHKASGAHVSGASQPRSVDPVNNVSPPSIHLDRQDVLVREVQLKPGQATQEVPTRSVSPGSNRMQEDQGSQTQVKTATSAQRNDNEEDHRKPSPLRTTQRVANAAGPKKNFDWGPVLKPASAQNDLVQQDQGRNAVSKAVKIGSALQQTPAEHSEREKEGKVAPPEIAPSLQRKHIGGNEQGIGSLERTAGSGKDQVTQQGDGGRTQSKTASAAQRMSPQDERNTFSLARETPSVDNRDHNGVRPISKAVAEKTDPALQDQDGHTQLKTGLSDQRIPIAGQKGREERPMVPETDSLQNAYEEQARWRPMSKPGSGHNDMGRHTQMRTVSSVQCRPRTGQTSSEDEVVLITVSVAQRKPIDGENVSEDHGNRRLMCKPLPFEDEERWAQTPVIHEDQQDLDMEKSQNLISTTGDMETSVRQTELRGGDQVPYTTHNFSVSDEVVTSQKLGDSLPPAEKLSFTLGPQGTPVAKKLSFSQAKPLKPMPKNMWMASERPTNGPMVQQHSLDQKLAGAPDMGEPPKLHEHRVNKPPQSEFLQTPFLEPPSQGGSRPAFDQQERLGTPPDIRFGTGHMDSAMDGAPPGSGFGRLSQGRAVTPPRKPPVSHGPAGMIAGYVPPTHDRPMGPLKQPGMPGMAVHQSMPSSRQVPAGNGEDILESPLPGRLTGPEMQQFVQRSMDVRDKNSVALPQRGTFGVPQKPDSHRDATTAMMQNASSSWIQGPPGMNASRFGSPLRPRATSPPRVPQVSAGMRDNSFAPLPQGGTMSPGPPRGPSMSSWLNAVPNRTDEDRFGSPVKARSLTPPLTSQGPPRMDIGDSSFSQGPDQSFDPGPQTGVPEEPVSTRVLPRNHKSCGSLNQGLPRICACGFGSPKGGPISPPKLPPFPQDHPGMDVRRECSFTHEPKHGEDGSQSGRASSPSKIRQPSGKDLMQKSGNSVIQVSAGLGADGFRPQLQGSPQPFSPIGAGVDTRNGRLASKGPLTSFLPQPQARSLSPTKMPHFLQGSSSMNMTNPDNGPQGMGGSSFGSSLQGRAVSPTKLPQFHQFPGMDTNRQPLPQGPDTSFQPPPEGRRTLYPAKAGSPGFDVQRTGSPSRQGFGERGFTPQVPNPAFQAQDNGHSGMLPPFQTSFSQGPQRPQSPIKGLGPMGMPPSIMNPNAPNPFNSFQPATFSTGMPQASPDAGFAAFQNPP